MGSDSGWWSGFCKELLSQVTHRLWAPKEPSLASLAPWLPAHPRPGAGLWAEVKPQASLMSPGDTLPSFPEGQPS